MPSIHIEIQPIKLAATGTLAIGTGFRRGLIHRTVARDGDGFAYIPASSFKGRVRRSCEQLAKSLGLHVCNPPQPARMCSAARLACLVCRVFGNPGKPGTLHWRDARLPETYQEAFDQNKPAQFYGKTQVQLNRTLGVASPGKLFTSESTVENLEFETAVTGRLQYTPIDDEVPGGYEMLLLLAGLKLINTLGGGASRGAGWVNCDLPETITITSSADSQKEVPLKRILTNLEYLHLFEEEATDEN